VIRYLESLLVLLLCGLLSPAHAAGYAIERGDVLEINVAGVPGLHRKAAVDESGQFSMPLIGDFIAAGLTVAELRDKLRDLLTEKNVVRRPEVTVDVAEYRPVYVSGDVMKPGAYPFRFGMTARDAVALAEGFDFLHLRGRDLLTAAADAKGDFQSAAVELAKQTARVARINGELAGKNELDTTALNALTVQPSIIAEVTQIERQQLIADLEDAEREKASIQRTLVVLQDQIASLQQGEAAASTSFEEESSNLKRARDLMQRGVLATSRLEDNQRAAAAAQNLLYDIRSRAGQARRDLEEVSRRLQVADDQRRIRLLQDLRDTVSLVEAAKVKLEASAEKIRLTGIAQVSASNADAEPPKIVIYRNSDGTRQNMKADAETALQPGDNIEITAKLDFAKLIGTSR
jgi:polysaccharide export outer membrane protein